MSKSEQSQVSEKEGVVYDDCTKSNFDGIASLNQMETTLKDDIYIMTKNNTKLENWTQASYAYWPDEFEKPQICQRHLSIKFNELIFAKKLRYLWNYFFLFADNWDTNSLGPLIRHWGSSTPLGFLLIFLW